MQRARVAALASIAAACFALTIGVAAYVIATVSCSLEAQAHSCSDVRAAVAQLQFFVSIIAALTLGASVAGGVLKIDRGVVRAGRLAAWAYGAWLAMAAAALLPW
jgi:hypothetical protein